MSQKRKEPDNLESQEKAVVDRIIDGAHAVLLIGDDETEQVLPTKQLPDHVTEGTWPRVTKDDQGRVAKVEVDENSTAEIEERITSKLEELRRRGRNLPPRNS